jgi:hypothetical protein
MKKHLIGAIAALGMVALPVAANAVVWTSQLEYRDGLSGAQSPSYGTVTLDEINATTVQVTVALTDSASRFINTGGPHNPFVFNTISDDVVTIVSGGSDNPSYSFFDGGHGSFMTAGFGAPSVPFTDEIGLGVYKSAVVCAPLAKHCTPSPAHWEDGPSGYPGGKHGPLVFTVANAGGITFAGLGYTTDSSGKLTGLGTGEHFQSTSLGWWFAADIYDGKTGLTYNVAARDAFGPTTGGIPEPAAWALMLVGFGGMGALLRRKRRLALASIA